MISDSTPTLRAYRGAIRNQNFRRSPMDSRITLSHRSAYVVGKDPYVLFRVPRFYPHEAILQRRVVAVISLIVKTASVMLTVVTTPSETLNPSLKT